MVKLIFGEKSDAPIKRKITMVRTRTEAGFLITNRDATVIEVIFLRKLLKFGGNDFFCLLFVLINLDLRDFFNRLNFGGIFDNPIRVVVDKIVNDKVWGKIRAGNGK